MDSSTIEAIDFRKLLREEKKKAREKRKNQASKSHSDETETPSPSSLPSDRTDDSDSISSIPPWNNGPLPPLPCLNSIDHCILETPPLIHYLPDFLPLLYQHHLIEWLSQLPPQQERFNSNNGSRSSSRADNNAVNHWNDLYHAKRRVALFVRADSTVFPGPMEDLANALQSVVFGQENNTQNYFNHILVNEYQRHQGILPHTDGPAYERCTATISLASDAIFLLQKKTTTNDNNDEEITSADNTLDDNQYSVLLQAGSLIVFRDAIYDDYLHSIAEGMDEEITSKHCLNAPHPHTRVKREFRISLTFRRKKEKYGDTFERWNCLALHGLRL